MSKINFLFQKLLIKQNHKTDSFFCVQYLYHDDISIYQFLIENIKSIFLSDFGQKIPLLSVGLKILKNMCWPQLSLLPIISQSLGKNLHKYMQNLKLIIKVKAKTPDMNIDKITKHKMDAKWQNFNQYYIPNTTKNFNHFKVVKFSLLHFWTFCQKNLATQKTLNKIFYKYSFKIKNLTLANHIKYELTKSLTKGNNSFSKIAL